MIEQHLWAEFSNAEDAFFGFRAKLSQSEEFGAVISQALQSPPPDCERALRLLACVVLERSLVVQLLPLVIELTVDGPTRSMDLASRVLLQLYEVHEVRSVIADRLEKYLGTGDYFLLRRVAQLLADHHLTDLLKTFVTRCRVHGDPDIREIAEDFSSEYE
jgi:hypothetical protein